MGGKENGKTSKDSKYLMFIIAIFATILAKLAMGTLLPRIDNWLQSGSTLPEWAS